MEQPKGIRKITYSSPGDPEKKITTKVTPTSLTHLDIKLDRVASAKPATENYWEKKDKFFENKDFYGEFGSALGQALNLARQDGKSFDHQEIENSVFGWFALGLKLKSSERFLAAFREYYEERESRKKGPAPMIIHKEED